MEKNEPSTNCDCGHFSPQTSIELQGIEVSSKKPLPKTKAPFWKIAWWWICWIIGSPWNKIFGNKDDDPGLSSFIFIGVMLATMFVSCTNKISNPLSENRNMLRDTLSEVNPTSQLMTSRKSIFNIPNTDLSITEETRIYNNPEESNVSVRIESSMKREHLYGEDFSIRNLKESYVGKGRLPGREYFHVVPTTDYVAINCYVRHCIEGHYIEVVVTTSEKRYVIESYLINLEYPPIKFLTKYVPPIMIEEEKRR